MSLNILLILTERIQHRIYHSDMCSSNLPYWQTPHEPTSYDNDGPRLPTSTCPVHIFLIIFFTHRLYFQKHCAMIWCLIIFIPQPKSLPIAYPLCVYLRLKLIYSLYGLQFTLSINFSNNLLILSLTQFDSRLLSSLRSMSKVYSRSFRIKSSTQVISVFRHFRMKLCFKRLMKEYSIYGGTLLQIQELD